MHYFVEICGFAIWWYLNLVVAGKIERLGFDFSAIYQK
jgi:hypothetical protein